MYHYLIIITCIYILQKTMSSELNARELAQYDDIATSLCVDPVVEFTTHKMNPRFRHVKGR